MQLKKGEVACAKWKGKRMKAVAVGKLVEKVSIGEHDHS